MAKFATNPIWSQHFFRDPARGAAVIAQLPLAADALVYEIGPGTGILTAALARRVKHVVAVEIDPALCAPARTVRCMAQCSRGPCRLPPLPSPVAGLHDCLQCAVWRYRRRSLETAARALSAACRAPHPANRSGGAVCRSPARDAVFRPDETVVRVRNRTGIQADGVRASAACGCGIVGDPSARQPSRHTSGCGTLPGIRAVWVRAVAEEPQGKLSRCLQQPPVQDPGADAPVPARCHTHPIDVRSMARTLQVFPNRCASVQAAGACRARA